MASHDNASKIVLLGTGTPNADPERSGPSVVIVVNQTPYVIDVGPGAVRRAAAACQAGIRGLEMHRLKRLFITHLHSDHTAGYPDFILTPWVLERDEPVAVYGPSGIREMTEHILMAYQQDIAERLDSLQPANEKGYLVEVHEIEAGIVYQDANIRVEAFPVNHGSLLSFGYKFYTPDRTIAISGDTEPAENILEYYQDCDVLIHEVYSVAGFETLSPDWQRYHASVHTSSRQLGKIASKVKPGLLILYHQLYWGIPDYELLLEVQEEYDGEVISGRDLEIY